MGGKKGIMQREVCLLINWCDCSWMRGIQDQENPFWSNKGMQYNADRQMGQLREVLLFFWSFCASLKYTDKMVFVSMKWTIPITMETRGLLAALILIIYCITMRKTISVTLMMITGFSAPPVRKSLLIFGDSFILRIFSYYIFRTFYLLMHNSSPPISCSTVCLFIFFLCHNSIVQ